MMPQFSVAVWFTLFCLQKQKPIGSIISCTNYSDKVDDNSGTIIPVSSSTQPQPKKDQTFESPPVSCISDSGLLMIIVSCS